MDGVVLMTCLRLLCITTTLEAMESVDADGGQTRLTLRDDGSPRSLHAPNLKASNLGPDQGGFS